MCRFQHHSLNLITFMAVILERNRFWRLVLWLNHENHVNLWYFTWDLSILLPRTHAWEACERHNRHLLAFFVSRSCHKWKQMWPCHARRWQCGRVAWVTCYMLDINRSLMMVQHVFLEDLRNGWMLAQWKRWSAVLEAVVAPTDISCIVINLAMF